MRDPPLFPGKINRLSQFILMASFIQTILLLPSVWAITIRRRIGYGGDFQNVLNKLVFILMTKKITAQHAMDSGTREGVCGLDLDRFCQDETLLRV